MGRGLLSKFDRSVTAEPAPASNPGCEWLSPAILENMLSSDDKSLNKSAIPLLLEYLRSHGRSLPLLVLLADWIDPNADTNWKLELKRRRRGSRPSHDRTAIKQAELFHRARELTDQFRVAGKLTPRKQAITLVAKQEGVTTKAVEVAITRFKKNLSK
jgi:hypothetical protein